MKVPAGVLKDVIAKLPVHKNNGPNFLRICLAKRTSEIHNKILNPDTAFTPDIIVFFWDENIEDWVLDVQ